MHEQTPARVPVSWAIAVLVLLVPVVAACGGSDAETGTAEAAETAETVCAMLRSWNNELGDEVNATSRSVTDADEPGTANGVLLDGFDRLIEIAGDHRAEVDDLDLPATQERDRLLDELRDGAEDAIAALEEERAKLEDLPPITVSAQRGVLGGVFIALERAGSLVEPEIGRYEDEELRSAFAANQGCEHVIQPF
jgi:hypothetical protein